MKKIKNGVEIPLTEEELNMFDTEQTPDIIGEIEQLKQQLAKTDYIITKSNEYKLVGKPDPYTQEELMQLSDEKDLIRDKINELEVELELSK